VTLISAPILCNRVDSDDSSWVLLGILIFLGSSAWTFFTSTRYHYVTSDEAKWFWKRMDHIAIYGMIAGSYTPFIIYYLWNAQGQRLLIFVWSIFLLGVVFKMYTAGRFRMLSTVLYILMGCSILLVADSFFSIVHEEVTHFLICGGLSYLIGAVFYLFKNWKYHHPVWHLFVMGGAGCHWWALWLMLR